MNVSIKMCFVMVYQGQLKRCKEAKKQLWREYPDIIYLFIGNRKTLDYYLEGIYEWNGREFTVT